MKPSTENQMAGGVQEVNGKTKEKSGQLKNDPNIEAEGAGEYIVGDVQKKTGKVEKITEKP